jgi:hypothetical protein
MAAKPSGTHKMRFKQFKNLSMYLATSLNYLLKELSCGEVSYRLLLLYSC